MSVSEDYYKLQDWFLPGTPEKMLLDKLINENENYYNEISRLRKEIEILKEDLLLANKKRESIISNVGESRIGDIDNLPEELVSQLKIPRPDVEEKCLVEVIQEFDGVANIDEILVGYFRATDKILNREQLSRKLYRMSQKGLIRTVPKKRGVYEL